MKMSELQIGTEYAGTKGERYVVVDTGFIVSSGGWSTRGVRARKVEKGGTHVAVARRFFNQGVMTWVPDYVAAFKIARVAPTQAEIDEGNRLAAERNAAQAKARAELAARTEAALAKVKDVLGDDAGYIPTDYSTGRISLTPAQIDALLAKAGA